MGQRKLRTVLADFLRSLQECRQLADDAHRWSLPGANGKRPYISRKRRDSIAEIAFLRAFLAWETFVEVSFILYLSGQKPPRGRAPYRYTFPPNQKAAIDWVVPEGRDFAKWTHPSLVSGRAERFFRDGRPFAPALRGNQNVLDEARLIRNAITHESGSAREKFENVARTRLGGTLPAKLTLGGFLGTIVPNSAPPISFLEFYVGKIEFAAQQIVPR
jgi:hypothetical protein